ncbi:MAG TPA: patatin-like phospholipase family protein [Gemmatimonas sp.]|nr:patatin-like phospholipase family protein [Gemmatimonas sp.]
MSGTTSAERSMRAVGSGQRRLRIGVVIGSGGIKCTAALGLWKVLQREGIEVDVFAGCSGGAIYTALMALGDDVIECERLTLELWPALFKRLHYRSLLRIVAPRVLGYRERIGLVDDRQLWSTLQMMFKDRDFNEARVPLFVSATDYRTGEKVVLNEGRVCDAIRASIAIPLLLRPWPVDERLLVDGGASNPLPVDVCIRENCDVIFAMGFESQMKGDVRSFVNALGRTTTIVTNHLLRSTFAFYSAAHHAEVLPVMPELDRSIGLTETQHIPYLIEQGERAAEAQLPYLRRLLAASAVETLR